MLGLSVRLINLVDSSPFDRWIRVRFEGHATARRRVLCGTPQGSPHSGVLYVVYLSGLLLQSDLRFGYADEVGFYAISNSVDTNEQLLSEHLSGVPQWGRENEVDFSPKKMELPRFYILWGKRRKQGGPAVTVDFPDGSAITVTPVPVWEKVITKDQREKWTLPALRWLGVYFDRRITWE